MPAKTQLTTGATTTTTSSGGTSAAPAVSQAAGNGAAQDRLKKVSGPIGRVWNNILGQPASANTADASVDQAMVRAYLDKRLGLAEGEMFRGMKLDGVAEKLVGTLDKDGDGKITWPEFQAFEGQILSVLAPGADKAGADVAGLASTQHGRIAGTDGRADLGELQGSAKAALPRGTEHADLVAQLGARVAIDAVDRDESNKPVSQRTLSREEWTSAATEAAGRSGR